MADSYNEYTNVSAGTDTFNFTFSVLQSSYVSVKVDGLVITTFTVAADLSSITLDTAASGGETVRVFS